jgi:hypothetical protein
MSTPLSRLLCAAVLLAGLLPAQAIAQEEGDGDEQQQLPEIAPREIEIRGELQLSFPSLERQPLRGFATPPTIPSVPPDHTPYVVDYKQTLDELPESLPASSAASQTLTSSEPPRQGLLEIGGGRYVSRFAKGRFTLPLSSQQRLSIAADYSGTNGYAPFDPAGLDTPSDNLDARVQFESRHDDLTLRAGVHGAASQYTLYGLPAAARDTAADAPDRSSSAAGTDLRLQSHGPVDASLRLSYDYTTYETEMGPSLTPPSRDVSTGRAGLDGSVTVPLGEIDARVDLAGSRSSLGGDAASHSTYSGEGGLLLRILDGTSLSLRAGGRFLGFSAPAAPTLADSPTASATFLLPQARLEVMPAPGVTVYAQNTPGLTDGTLSSLYGQNPYAESIPSLRPTVTTTDAEGGLRLSAGAIQLRARGGYRYAPSYRFFTTPSGPGADETPFQVDYESARILHGGAELALQGVDGVEASAGFSVRDGILVGDDRSIPYFSPIVADAMLSISFADRRGLLQTTGRIESPRPVDAAETSEVGTYVSVDVEGSFQITSLLDVVARIENIGPDAPERWARYPQPPTSVMGGFRIHW